MHKEPWYVVRAKEGLGLKPVTMRAESRVFARMLWEAARPEDEILEADEIAWIEGPFKEKPKPINRYY